MVGISIAPELFKYKVGQVVFYEAFRGGKSVMFSGVVMDAYKSENGKISYVVNDTADINETQLFGSVAEYKRHEILESTNDFSERLESLHNEIAERNQFLADFIMTASNSVIPAIKLDNETHIVRVHHKESNLPTDDIYITEKVNRIVIFKNDDGKYTFSFSTQWGYDMPQSETVFDTDVIINNCLEDYIKNNF